MADIKYTGGKITVTASTSPSGHIIETSDGCVIPSWVTGVTTGETWVGNVSENTGDARSFRLEVKVTTESDPSYEGVASSVCGWTVTQEGVVIPIVWSLYNKGNAPIYGNLRGTTDFYASMEVLPEEIEEHSEPVPATITDAYVGVYPGLTPSTTITFTNTRTLQSISCHWSETANAFIGTGTINLIMDDMIEINIT